MVVVEERGVRICAAYWYRISVGFRLKRRGIGKNTLPRACQVTSCGYSLRTGAQRNWPLALHTTAIRHSSHDKKRRAPPSSEHPHYAPAGRRSCGCPEAHTMALYRAHSMALKLHTNLEIGSCDGEAAQLQDKRSTVRPQGAKQCYRYEEGGIVPTHWTSVSHSTTAPASRPTPIALPGTSRSATSSRCRPSRHAPNGRKDVLA